MRKGHVMRKNPITLAMLQEAVDNIRGAVMICYPMGLPEWDSVRQCLEGREYMSENTVSRSQHLAL